MAKILDFYIMPQLIDSSAHCAEHSALLMTIVQIHKHEGSSFTVSNTKVLEGTFPFPFITGYFALTALLA